MSARTRFRILHSLRAPIGGLFRHVCDLAAAQQRAGHEVAVVCATTGNALTEAKLSALQSAISLGVHRIASARNPGISDAAAVRRVGGLARELSIDVLHGHGAKGGAYARLAGRGRDDRIVIYTPHGGSLHYAPTSMAGRIVSFLERRLEARGHGIIFESRYAATCYAAQIGTPRVASRVIPNGVGEDDFRPPAPTADATDVLFVGELRRLKGVDVLLDALALVAATRPVSATIVGAGPDRDAFEAQARTLGLGASTRFVGAKPAREAFNLGRIMVMPSRAESFPYIALEAGAAGLPLIATQVGGVPELVGETGIPLLPPGNATALATVLLDVLGEPRPLHQQAAALQTRVREKFTVAGMADAVSAFYADVAELQAAGVVAGRLAVSSK